MISINTVLLSVTDKTGLAEFTEGLRKINPSVTFIASGGTGNTLSDHQIPYTPLKEYTQFPECFGGRVKTLHPYIAGGILFRRGEDDQEAQRLGVRPIDMVVCNLYAFKNDIESMDIGGSTLIRSACKNYASCALVVDTNDYSDILKEIKENQGKLSLATREKLAIKGLNTSADYEAMLARELTKELSGEETHRPRLVQGQKLRYGENPDQEAWIYKFPDQNGIAHAEVLAGKQLSYNNYEDATVANHAAQHLLEIGTEHGVAIVKHGSLCGYATGPTLTHGFRKAWEGDSKSAFGSIIAFTSQVNDKLIEELKGKFVEVLIASSFSDSFVTWTKTAKPNLRLLQVSTRCHSPLLYKNVSGGMLVQTRKEKLIPVSLDDLLKPSRDKRTGVVTKRQPEPNQKVLFAFAISACMYAKSNAIAIVRETTLGHYQLLGIGSGQPNRVDSLQRLAIPKAIENLRKEHTGDPKHNPKSDLERCVLASDGFFPFDDSIRFAAANGIQHYIQPGGSTRDQEVIDTADSLNVCMIFTGQRYFSH